MIESSYQPGSSFVHNFDPRAKLVLMAAWTVVFFFPFNLSFLGIYAGTVFLLALPAAGLRKWLVPVKMLLPVLIMILLLTPPFIREGEPLAVYHRWTLITDAGLFRTLQLLIRIIGISYVFFVFFSSTPVSQLILALRWFGMPLRAALIVSMSFRFIPFVAATFQQVSNAHKLRGSFQTGMWGWSQLKGVIPVLTSVLIKAIKMIPVTAMSLEHRGFGGPWKRSVYQRLRGGRTLFTHLIFSVMISAILFSVPYLVQ